MERRAFEEALASRAKRESRFRFESGRSPSIGVTERTTRQRPLKRLAVAAFLAAASLASSVSLVAASVTLGQLAPYHAAVVATGIITGVGASLLGRVTGRILLLASVGMALMYAAGVT
jgi:hypothetical protein